ncbi:uncharacterized protein LOC141695091 isoform X2 [Apium graveolens]|uniref:uncharacterized protein LOC141695091 isoform X2 n=1 Tax=Apium graveolens TaxID=4045 RepID=UPI003D7A9175
MENSDEKRKELERRYDLMRQAGCVFEEVDDLDAKQRQEHRNNQEKNLKGIPSILEAEVTTAQMIKRNEQRRAKYKKEKLLPGSELSNQGYDSSKLIIRPTLQFGDLPVLSKNMRTRINKKKQKFALSNEILDMSIADKICYDCGAVMWRYEQTEQQKTKLKKVFFMLQ